MNQLEYKPSYNPKFSTINMNGLDNVCTFSGSINVDKKFYFTPYYEDVIVLLDIENNKFNTLSLDEKVSGSSKFNSSVVVDRRIYFTP